MNNVRYYKNLNHFIKENTNNSKQQFLLVSEKCTFDIKTLQNTNITFSGAIVPQIIYEDNNCTTGLIASDINPSTDVFLIEDMNSYVPDKELFEQSNSITIILDGLSKHISSFLDVLFEVIPHKANLIGGGAGKLSLNQEPVIFNNKGIFENAALLLSSLRHLHLGVESGCEYLEGPFIASSSEKTLLKSLDFEDAFTQYKNVVEKDSGKILTDENFFEISQQYPLGIIRLNKEIVVRAPIARNKEGHLVLVGDIEQNSIVHILKSNKESLIQSSKNAAKNALSDISEKEYEQFENVILFDCISRCTFLEKDFQKELSAIKNQITDKKLFGALTLGEIANKGSEYLNFYNKTCVVGIQY